MIRYRAEVVVVGSGAGGSAAARELARAGRDVLVLEMGERLGPGDFRQREELMMPRLFQEGGGRATVDGSIGVIQGQGVGGSTLHNLNLCKRVPPELLELWERRQALPGLAQRLTEHYAVMERDLGVVQVQESEVNRHNALFAAGCAALGLKHARLFHNRSGCVGSGFCELGCAYDAKNNAARVLLPEVQARGGRVLAQHRVERLLSRWGRARGLRGWCIEGGRREAFEVEAEVVVLAASATASAALVLASGLDDPARLSGLGLHLHPAATVAAVFDEELRAWKGVPQSVECTEHLHGTDPARRLWLLPVFAHPAGVAGMMPGFGPALMERMRQYPHLAAASAMLHDHGSGRVSADREGRPRLHYQLDPADGAALAHGMAEAARIWLAAGARVVLPPDGEPVTSLAGAERLRERPARPQDPPLIAVHPMGGLAMAGSPHRGPVDPEGRHRGLRGLWVADGSLFPTSTGGPPQLTIYAFGRMVGQAIAAA